MLRIKQSTSSNPKSDKASRQMDKNQDSRTVSMGRSGQPSRKRSRKAENPTRVSPTTEPSSDSRYPSKWICGNSACRAEVSVVDIFCKRCSCCICHQCDENKDPSLWLECTPDSPASSCGFSCHIECAFQQQKVGVVDLGQAMQLDGNYCCASCGRFSGILECWKRQLKVALDCRRVDSLCSRINLSFRLFNGTSKFHDLHEIIEVAKNRLESEVGSLDGVAARLARGHVNRLSVAAEVQALCVAAIQKADEFSAALTIASMGEAVFTKNMEIPNQNNAVATVPQNEGTSGAKDPEPDAGNKVLQLTLVDEPGTSRSRKSQLDLNVPASCEGADPNDSTRDEAAHGSGGSANRAQHGPNEELPAVDSQAETRGKRPVSTEAHHSDSALAQIPPVPACRGPPPENMEQFRYCVEMICGLEREKHIEEEFRKKLLTWLGVGASEPERQVVHTFIQVLEDDPPSLAAQLVHSYADIVN